MHSFISINHNVRFYYILKKAHFVLKAIKMTDQLDSEITTFYNQGEHKNPEAFIIS